MATKKTATKSGPSDKERIAELETERDRLQAQVDWYKRRAGGKTHTQGG